MKNKFSQEIQFGIVFIVFFLIIIIYQYFIYNKFFLTSIILLSTLLAITIFVPKLLKIPSKLWIKLGELIGKITTPLIIILLFVFVIIPTSMIMKIVRKDILDENFNRKIESYWKKRVIKKTNHKQQF